MVSGVRELKILIIKLGAMGDVLRTTPLLTALKRRYPDSVVTWVVDASCREVLEGNAAIDRLLDYSPETLRALSAERFDLAVNLDKDAEALETMAAANAAEKKGFGRDDAGRLIPIDAASDYAYRLGVDDDLKFRKNTKTYQAISFEQLGLHFDGEEYVLPLNDAPMASARRHLSALGIDLSGAVPVIGLNTGSGHRFAGKKLPLDTYALLAQKLKRELGAVVLLLGGKSEIDRNIKIERLAGGASRNTGSHSLRDFAGIVKHCHLVLTGDTIALHVAIAVKTPVVAFFASTCAAEIELYGRGHKIVSGISCAPCYKKICPIDEQCMKDIRVDELFRACRDALKHPASARAC